MEPEWLSVLLAQTEERTDPWVLLEGQAVVEAALAGWWEVPGVLLGNEHPWEVPTWSGLEELRRPDAELEGLADPVRHGGVLGIAKMPRETAEVAAFMRGLAPEALLVVCPRLDDPSMIGEIMRGAESFDAAGVIFGAEGRSPFEPDAVQASGGALFKLPVRIADGGLILRSLLAADFQLVGLDDSPDAIAAANLPALTSRRALVFGDEEGKLGKFWKSACNLRVRGDADTVLSHLAL